MTKVMSGNAKVFVNGIELTGIGDVTLPTIKARATHDWDWVNGEGERCIKCGDKDYMADEYCSESKVNITNIPSREIILEQLKVQALELTGVKRSALTGFANKLMMDDVATVGAWAGLNPITKALKT